jgi:hypothetical protein
MMLTPLRTKKDTSTVTRSTVQYGKKIENLNRRFDSGDDVLTVVGFETNK